MIVKTKIVGFDRGREGGTRLILEPGGSVALTKAHAIGCLLRARAPGDRMRSAAGYLDMIDRSDNTIRLSMSGLPGQDIGTPVAWCVDDVIEFNPEEM